MKKVLTVLWHAAAVFALSFLTVGVLWTLVLMPVQLDKPSIVWPFLVGFGVGVVFFILVSRVQVMYVFGHELTHWVVAKLFMRDTGEMKVSTSGGSVAIQQPNIWITLAPYFVPLYTLLWLLAYAIFRYGYGQPPPLQMLRIFYGGIGLTYAFHVVMTYYSLQREQTDLRQHGYLLSLSLVLCFNAIVLACGMLTVSGQWTDASNTLQHRLGVEWNGVAAAYAWFYSLLADLGDWVRGLWGRR